LGIAWSRYNQLALSGPELSIPYAMFMSHFVHGLSREFTEYLDMAFGGAFVHCTVEERKLISYRILSITLLEDMQIIAHQEFLMSFARTVNHAAEDELE
jgi:hypothetical protein